MKRSAATPVQGADASGWLAAALFVAVLAGLGYVVMHMNGPITAVHVVGNLTAVEQQEVRRAVSRRLDAGVLDVRLHMLVDDVMMLAWPRDVHVRRVWPGMLEVRVEKEAVAARWGDVGAVTTSGEIIEAESAVVERLPLLEAARTDAVRTMQIYHRLRAVLRRTELEITALREDALGEWHITLNDEVTVALGHEHLAQRLERVVAVYNGVLADNIDAVAGMDARYTNGVAVRWQDGRKPQGAATRQIATAPR
jgi:cell division protein FtsQ